MSVLRLVECGVIIVLLQILSNANCVPVVLLHEELVSRFGQHSRTGAESEAQMDDDQLGRVCDYPSSKLEFIIEHVPLVNEGYISMKCECMLIESEGVPDLNGSQLRGLNCTSDNNLLSSSSEFEIDDNLKKFISDSKLIESLYKSYIDKMLKLEVILSIGKYGQGEDFCRVNMVGFGDDLVVFPKLDTEHYSLIEVGMSFCHFMGKRENIFFEHPSPVTEILEGDIFHDSYYFAPDYNQDEEFEKISKYYDDGDIFEWDQRPDDLPETENLAEDGQNDYGNYHEESWRSENSNAKSGEDYYGVKYSFSFDPFLRLSYKSKKSYPRLFIRSNVPYTKSINALDRSAKNNYYSVAGKWQLSLTPGYSRVIQDNSILSILGSKYNSAEKEAFIIEKLRDIAFRWKRLTFSNSHAEFVGCNVGKKNEIPRYVSSFKVFDPTNKSFNKYPSNLQMESVFEIMNSGSAFNSFQAGGSHCSFNGNIRECLRLIRSRIRDKTLNYILGYLFINIIYESWITWGSEVWHIASLHNVGEVFAGMGSSHSDFDPLSSLFTRLFNVQPLVDDKSLDIISFLKSNLERKDLDTCSLEVDIFQFGVFSVNPLLLKNFWTNFSENYCKVVSDSAFVTWITNKFSLKLQNKREQAEGSSKAGTAVSGSRTATKTRSWLTNPLPTYFDQVDPEVEVEYNNDIVQEEVLPEVYEYSDLLEVYNKNDLGVEKENSVNRRRFFNSNYFSRRNRQKWVSFIVRNVPFRDNKKKSLEFKCGIGSWPYKGGEYSWISSYMCEVIFLSSRFSSHMFDFSTYDSYYNSVDDRDAKYASDLDESGGRSSVASLDDKKESYFSKLSRNRMIGIEFEIAYPHRCAIGYLGNESEKTLTAVKGNQLLKVSLGFCILHGFKLQWLSDDSFNIYTEALYKYTQVLESGLTYYERNGFELSGSIQQKVYSNNTCSGVSLYDSRGEIKASTENNYGEVSRYGFKSQTMECQISYDPTIVTDGMRKDELIYMRDKYANLLYELRFGCDNMESRNNDYMGVNNHCLNFYPLLEKVKLESNKWVCKFELTKEWKYLNKHFPEECRIGSRVGDCHKKARKEMKCVKVNNLGCKLDLFITNNFIKPVNIERISIHFNQISLLLMNGINKYTADWDKAGVDLVHDLIANLVSRKDLDHYLENGIKGIIESRLSLFMDEFSKHSSDPILKEAKDLFSYSGIWLDTHTIPLLWRLVMFRIEDIPLFVSRQDLFTNVLKDSNKSFRFNSKNDNSGGGAGNVKGDDTDAGGSRISRLDSSIKKRYDITSSIPLYCPLAIGYFWIDKFMWQMYRYPGSSLQNVLPIKT